MPRRKGDAKATYKLSDIMSPSFDLPSDHAELIKVYRTVAKAADQRLVRLEKLTGEENFRIADKWAYARAIRDIEAWSGSGATRFNVAPPKSTASLQAKIEDIRHFLESPTSTKTGIKNIYVTRAAKINKEYGTNFTWEDIGTFFENKGWKYLAGGGRRTDGKYESKTVLKAIATVKKTYSKEDIQKAVNKVKDADIKVPDDQVGRTIRQILKNKKQSKILLDLLYE